MSAAVKKFKPILQRADELEVLQPLVSYYCRVFAAEGLMKAKQGGDTDPGLVPVLLAALDGAEKLKANVDTETGPQKFEEFSMMVFKAADDDDRAGKADQQLAMRFYASSLFLDANSQFHNGELPPDLAEMRKYARYKTAYIRDCIKKGVTPEAGPPGGDKKEETAAPTAKETGLTPLPPPSVVSPAPGQSEAAGGYASQPSPPVPLASSPSTAPSAAAPPQEPTTAGAPAASGAQPSRKRMMEAKKKAEYAASALEFDDVPTAKRLLAEALRELDS